METPCREIGKFMILSLNHSIGTRCPAQRLLLAAMLAIGLCGIAGCRQKLQLPKTCPVRGKVVFRQGGPFPGGTIQFQSLDRPSVSASGKIGPDGTFELTSFIAGDQAPGAVAGRHRVIITPPFIGGAPPTIPPVPPQEITVSEGENNLTITVDRK
jgi:hypothetical protein